VEYSCFAACAPRGGQGKSSLLYLVKRTPKRVFISCSGTLSLGEKRSGTKLVENLAKYRRFSTAFTGYKYPLMAGYGKIKEKTGRGYCFWRFVYSRGQRAK